MRCALNLTIKDRVIFDAEVNTVWQTGMSLQRSSQPVMSFPVFVLMADLYRVFSALESPEFTG